MSDQADYGTKPMFGDAAHMPNWTMESVALVGGALWWEFDVERGEARARVTVRHDLRYRPSDVFVVPIDDAWAEYTQALTMRGNEVVGVALADDELTWAFAVPGHRQPVTVRHDLRDAHGPVEYHWQEYQETLVALGQLELRYLSEDPVPP